MAGPFDGMAGALNQMFGAPVTYQPQGGGQLTVQSIFREEPLTVTGEDGRDVLIQAPTWKVPQNLALGMARGDLIQPDPAGPFYRIVNRLPTGSPAFDRFVLFDLEEVVP